MVHYTIKLNQIEVEELRMLADKMVELNYIDYISHVSVGEVLKKTNLSLGK